MPSPGPSFTAPRVAITLAGVLRLATPLLLPRRTLASKDDQRVNQLAARLERPFSGYGGRFWLKPSS